MDDQKFSLSELDSLIEREKAMEPNPYAATRILQRIDDEYGRGSNTGAVAWMRVLRPVAVAGALACGILAGNYAAQKDAIGSSQGAGSPGNIDILKSTLFISEFADEDKLLILNQ